MKNLFMYLLLIIGFSVSAQSLTSVSPNTGAAGTTINITITGNRTAFTNSTVFVFNSGTSVLQVSNVAAQSGTSATGTITIPANAAAGVYSLSAVIGLSLPLQLANAFTVTGGAPTATIGTISPSQANTGQTLLVTISGVNTEFTQSSTTTSSLVNLGGGTPIVAITTFAQNDNTVLSFFSIPSTATPGVYSMLVSTTNQGILTKQNAFTINGGTSGNPELASIAPTSSTKGQRLNVTITGKNTQFTQASTVEVYLSGNAGFYQASSTVTQSDTRLRATFDIPTNASSGLYDVEVLLDGDNLVLEQSFEIIGDPLTDPAVVSISPSFGAPGQILDVTITGKNTNFTQGSNTLDMAIFNQATYVSPSTFDVISNTQIVARFEIPIDFGIGVYDFGLVSDFDGFMEMPQSFNITAVGIAEQQNTLVNMYPNPVKDKLMIESTITYTEITIIDITGKQTSCNMNEMQHIGSIYTIPMDKFGLKKGIYFIRLESDSGYEYQKFIVE